MIAERFIETSPSRNVNVPGGRGILLDARAVVLDELLYDVRLGAGREVAEAFVLPRRDLAQDPSHDLPAPRLGEAGRDLHDVGRRERADDLADLLLEDARHLLAVALGMVGRERHVRVDALALDRVGEAHDRR